ncbi:hypothetical protein m07a_11150 [Bartonella schoenbuchensis m07a]|uniref:Right handed beta helix domain-containing protein n=2 Tax=Bartonella schoenbuchensis TaxID=165694 RepID=N6UKM9_9HYPH|nr:hypothetical protein m07a_11150 [Bartonella schoenbuchensis m07a]
MVMRCVLKHHVCLCVLSTAVLAGLALITAQTKVYAQSQNCNGIANSRATGVPGDPSGDSPNRRIECDGSGKYERGKKINTLSGNRTIDMDKDLKPAVKVHNGADITIVSDTLIITDSSQSKSTSPAIQVESGGKLMLAGNVDIKDVKKGIVADGKGSSVTVNRGKIGVRAGGGYVIGVQNGGEVTLSRGVMVNSVGSMGIVVGGTGGSVTLGGTRFTGVNKGIVFMGDKGTANATVMGVGGATISLADGNSTGVIMQGTRGANATVMNMTINGGRGSVGAEVTGEGTLMLNMVNISQVQMGARVTKGKLTVMGGEIQGNTMGVEVSEKGVLKVMGEATIGVGRNGTGLSVTGEGNATMMGGMIQASGGDGMTGVIVNTSGDVTLSGGVTISQFKTGGLCKEGGV